MGTVTSYSAAKIDSLLNSIQSGVSQEQLDQAIANLRNAAPAVLDTLNELATAMGNDPNFAATINAALADRVRGTPRVTVSSSPPPSPAVNDVWVDIS